MGGGPEGFGGAVPGVVVPPPFLLPRRGGLRLRPLLHGGAGRESGRGGESRPPLGIQHQTGEIRQERVGWVTGPFFRGTAEGLSLEQGVLLARVTKE